MSKNGTSSRNCADRKNIEPLLDCACHSKMFRSHDSICDHFRPNHDSKQFNMTMINQYLAGIPTLSTVTARWCYEKWWYVEEVHIRPEHLRPSNHHTDDWTDMQICRKHLWSNLVHRQPSRQIDTSITCQYTGLRRNASQRFLIKGSCPSKVLSSNSWPGGVALWWWQKSGAALYIELAGYVRQKPMHICSMPEGLRTLATEGGLLLHLLRTHPSEWFPCPGYVRASGRLCRCSQRVHGPLIQGLHKQRGRAKIPQNLETLKLECERTQAFHSGAGHARHGGDDWLK